jgi:hypothetical protein
MFTLQRYENNYRNVLFCLLFINNDKPYFKLRFGGAELKEEDVLWCNK